MIAPLVMRPRGGTLTEKNLSKNQGLLFILGAGKTATTSLCGLLNSHPDVFVMYEVYLNRSEISRYGNKLVHADPDLMPCFFRPHGADAMENYRRAHRLLREKGHAKRFFGDKLVGIDSGYADSFRDVHVIFSVRTVQEWIAKDSVRTWFPLDTDLVPFATQYAKHFVESFLLPKVYHVRMDEFLNDNAGVARGIWKFLDLEPPACAGKWWETVGAYPPGDPKQALNWWRGHASSAVAPQANDTHVELRRNPFWDEVLPIFDKYYRGVHRRDFARAEIEADLATLQNMIGRHRYPFASCFTAVASESRNAKFKAEQRRRAKQKGKLGRVLTKIGIR
jgi:hypothetical protein